ncbi:Uncharacterized protein dnm_064700 [Desulfonema magnum]|uniref:Uncharacterized protein n=1 Tax=Desulfonema magnum TaxID=45655 RepID=A0A975BRB1_9BACT|nr:Uncharacterized protein dnm_064700 [Desulfonema magnum]
MTLTSLNKKSDRHYLSDNKTNSIGIQNRNCQFLKFPRGSGQTPGIFM